MGLSIFTSAENIRLQNSKNNAGLQGLYGNRGLRPTMSFPPQITCLSCEAILSKHTSSKLEIECRTFHCSKHRTTNLLGESLKNKIRDLLLSSQCTCSTNYVAHPPHRQADNLYLGFLLHRLPMPESSRQAPNRSASVDSLVRVGPVLFRARSRSSHGDCLTIQAKIAHQ